MAETDAAVREARWHGTRVRLLAGDITSVTVDAIVNAANSHLSGGGGVDGAIHAAAGPTVMQELRDRYRGDGCPTGQAVITAAGDLDARMIIHAVGPIWRGGDLNEPLLLGSAYTSSLDLVSAERARSVAFPAISCGVYAYPLGPAASVALDAVSSWLSSHPESEIDDIMFVLRGEPVMGAFSTALDSRPS
jgi:O-acetyl-ADP-ribose deacetylase (regulator of RNase III)